MSRSRLSSPKRSLIRPAIAFSSTNIPISRPCREVATRTTASFRLGPGCPDVALFPLHRPRAEPGMLSDALKYELPAVLGSKVQLPSRTLLTVRQRRSQSGKKPSPHTHTDGRHRPPPSALPTLPFPSSSPAVRQLLTFSVITVLTSTSL